MYSEVIAASVINKLGAKPNYLLLGEKHTTYILIKICNRGFRAWQRYKFECNSHMLPYFISRDLTLCTHLLQGQPWQSDLLFELSD